MATPRRPEQAPEAARPARPAAPDALPPYRTLRERLAIDGTADLVVRPLRDRNPFSDPLGEVTRRMQAGGFTLVQTLLPGARLLHDRRAA